MDLTTDYLGMRLKNPLVPSASPLSRSIDDVRRMEDAGASAVIMYSLFEESVTAEEETMVRFLHHQDTGFAEADSFLPDHYDFSNGQERYLENLRALKQAVEIPVIASLNGTTPGGWITHATEMEQAGADAIELNIYQVAADIETGGSEIEQRYVELLTQLEQRVNLPINMKLSPAFSAMANMVKQLETAGANGVSLFNRFYQPDINIDNMRLTSTLHTSNSSEVLLAMRWIAILYGRTKLSLGATGGVHTSEDVIKLLLAGADVVHLCSLLLEQGPTALAKILDGIEQWMEEKGFESIEEFRGRLSQISVADPTEFERVNYVHILDSFSFGPGVRS
ncbi:MAG: dihydroorotate dehydrogenase-like protein [Candidatus Thiodiazotropha lotti]|uniref:Dihydroorotate dehydrogenase n=1 Tax=Candidatus Thiodiazotropha endoloripes TaxID=1818881 RepID=A0A1E2UUI9_9GAMM|nr:dihydroorotate dehydrogenase-like protein [Candidatus Thiodiazotropha endoloripes]MCG7898267.1 dihydroorotate dehydrogenase-like protein [Candidatus Thiodiazotropha weberae]MCG7992159.1 dihydroorotate dehydrogenase-like protein [Candidatus Thiodiazotropha lotti]MCG7903364.1 dihydroorotate dehydrogenase-like protein [Candidatus Thiodiazotropha weberae]MCG7915326.1 dihydroorotate dehydrogenase-like protein [Candidatus Thiodiazotropha weberae]MCG7998664.1 dihydroorotate dehydrogenase-like prot